MLKTNICGVEFQNPLMLAAGIMGSNASSMNWILKSGAGGVVSKSFSLNPHPGYVNPTTVAVDGGIINAIGLSNPGVENFKEELKKIEIEAEETKKINELDKKYIVVYVHNLSYEFQFISRLFEWVDIFADSERKPIKAETKDHIIFKCS